MFLEIILVILIPLFSFFIKNSFIFLQPILLSYTKIHHITKTQITEFIRSIGYLFIVGGITSVCCLGLPNTFDISFFVGSIISSIILNPLREAAGRLTIPSFISSGYQEFIKIQKKYYDIEFLLTDSMKQFGRIAIEDYARDLEYEIGVTKYKDLFEKELFRYSVGVQPIHFCPIKIQQFLSKYPNSIKKPIIRFITQDVERFQHPKTTQDMSTQSNIKSNLLISTSQSDQPQHNPINNLINKIYKSDIKPIKTMIASASRKTPLMFIGPPGTGKTFLATTLGRCLNIPTQIINLSTYQDVNGTYGYKYSDNGNFGLFEDLTIGDLNTNNYQNRFVVLSKDKSLSLDNQGNFINKNGSSILHQLLDTKITELSIRRYDGATINISKLNFILIANETFTTVLGKDKARALESRIKIINFDEGFSWDKKEKIVYNQLKLFPDLQNEICKSKIQNIINYDHNTLHHKGVRILLNVINEYINHIQNSDILAELLCIIYLILRKFFNHIHNLFTYST